MIARKQRKTSQAFTPRMTQAAHRTLPTPKGIEGGSHILVYFNRGTVRNIHIQ